MPYKVTKVKGGYKVKKKSGGRWSGSRRPLTRAQALRQQRAIYAHERAHA